MNTTANSPLISIIVPIYNSGSYLNKCISTITNQTYQKIEIILVDDGSTDNGKDICDNWITRDTRIKYFHQSNSGVSTARNRGIAEAQGELLCFIDSDDWLENNHVETLYEGILQNRADMATVGYTKIETTSGRCTRITHSSEKVIILREAEGEALLLELFKSRLLYCPFAHIFKTDIIKTNELAFKPNMNYGEDRLFILEYLAFCSRISPRCIATYNYRIENPNSLSSIEDSEVLPYEKIFYHANSQYLDKMQFFSKQAREWAATPLFHAYMDVLLQAVSNSPFSVLKHIKSIMKDRLFFKIITQANTTSYSRFLIFLLKKQLTIPLSIILMFRRLLHPAPTDKLTHQSKPC